MIVCGKTINLNLSEGHRAHLERMGRFIPPDCGELECVKGRGHPGDCWAPRPDGLLWSPGIDHHDHWGPKSDRLACEYCSGTLEWRAEQDGAVR